VSRFHDASAAQRAKDGFIARFQKGAIPDEMPRLELPAHEGGALPIANLLKEAGLVKSTSEALRMIGQGAVRVDGQRIEDRALALQSGTTHVYQVGKRRFALVTVR
jgi:tyrosyl-tRNA synthetase